jgi:proline dehydrogenase
MITRTVLLKLAESPGFERFVRRSSRRAPFLRRFVAGETMEEAVEPVRVLNRRGLSATLDYLGENVHSEAEAAETVAYYHRLIPYIAEQGLHSGVSLKLTQLGLDIDAELTLRNMQRILQCAREHGRFVRIDMEGSAYTAGTLEIFHRLRGDFENVGIVVQSYLHRTEADVERLIETQSYVRLVKGAYKEPAEVAFQAKSEVDACFVRCMKALLERGRYPAVATHDPALIEEAARIAKQAGVPADKFEYQMLYGIRRDLQDGLVGRGYRMRVYVPFGTQWYGYFMRRLAERPANIWFVLKNLLRS